MKFNDLALIEPLLKSLAEEGYAEPTPIQVQAIPPVLEGRDLLGVAQTGTGKTAAFALPILQRLTGVRHPVGTRRPIRALVLTPTRELATQILESFRAYGRHLHLKHTVVYGGVGQRPQTDALSRGVDVLVATPGRLLDLMNQHHVRLDRVETFVLDEADRMLDMGFLADVKRILAALPAKRQTLFFSATMGGEPASLAKRILTDPVRVEVTPPATTVEKVEQSVHHVAKADKPALLEHLLGGEHISRALVFTRTKHGANRLATRLDRAGIRAGALHANKSQGQRERALAAFRAGHVRVLVATDIAARGLDVDDISHVVNFDLPNVPEAYVHRIGRTARAGASGTAIAFCDPHERGLLQDIERQIRMRIPVADTPPALRAAANSERRQQYPHGHGSARSDERRPSHSGGGHGGAQHGAARSHDRRPTHHGGNHGAARSHDARPSHHGTARSHDARPSHQGEARSHEARPSHAVGQGSHPSHYGRPVARQGSGGRRFGGNRRRSGSAPRRG